MAPTNPIAALDRFIAPGSPIARAGGARMLLRVTGGNVAGAAVLAAIAKAESGFGANVGRFTNNAFGYGVHEGPSVYTSPTWEAGAAKVWKSLNSSLYKGAGYNTLPKIIQRYVTGSDGNDMSAYTRNTSSWLQSVGINPNANIFTGSGGSATTDAGGAAPPSALPASIPAGSLDTRALMKLLSTTQAQVLQGRMPGPEYGQQLAKIAQGAYPAATGLANTQQAGARVAGAASAVANAAGGGTQGFPTGPVDSGKATPGGAGGDWGGSMQRALALAKSVGATPSSQKRSRKLTASGNPSDHWVGSTQSYATDLPTSGAAGDALFKRVVTALGMPGLKSGTWQNVTIGGYRYQIGWRVPGHYDHVHVGVKKI